MLSVKEIVSGILNQDTLDPIRLVWIQWLLRHIDGVWGSHYKHYKIPYKDYST